MFCPRSTVNKQPVSASKSPISSLFSSLLLTLGSLPCGFLLTFPFPPSRCLSPLLVCQAGGLLYFAACIPPPVPAWRPLLHPLLESQSPPVPSFRRTGGRLEKVLLPWGGGGQAPVLLGGQACVQAGPGALPTSAAAACWTSARGALAGCCLGYQPASLAPNDCASLDGL